MKKIIVPFLVGLLLFVSCKKDTTKVPNHLIEKEKMVDIMCDLSILGAMRNQNPALLDSFKETPNEYIYKKYKIDSTQFAQSNVYYAADLKEYEKMYEQVKLRLDKDKIAVEAAIKIDEKEKAKSMTKEEKDSMNGSKMNNAKVSDSIRRFRRKALLGV